MLASFFCYYSQWLNWVAAYARLVCLTWRMVQTMFFCNEIVL